jgi:hypothetical protein
VNGLKVSAGGYLANAFADRLDRAIAASKKVKLIETGAENVEYRRRSQERFRCRPPRAAPVKAKRWASLNKIRLFDGS